jgi:hypothetical protein
VVAAEWALPTVSSATGYSAADGTPEWVADAGGDATDSEMDMAPAKVSPSVGALSTDVTASAAADLTSPQAATVSDGSTGETSSGIRAGSGGSETLTLSADGPVK